MYLLTDILDIAVERELQDEVDLEAVCGWSDADSETVEGLYEGDLLEAVDEGWHEVVVGGWSKADLETAEGWKKADSVTVVGWPDLDSVVMEGWSKVDSDEVGGCQEVNLEERRGWSEVDSEEGTGWSEVNSEEVGSDLYLILSHKGQAILAAFYHLSLCHVCYYGEELICQYI